MYMNLNSHLLSIFFAMLVFVTRLYLRWKNKNKTQIIPVATFKKCKCF